MQRKTNPFDRFSPLPSFPYPDTTISSRQSFSSSSSDAKISPAVLLVIIILSIAFFVCGLLHLFVRLLIKRSSIHSFSLSRRYPENSSSNSLQRQLHHLFRLHDCGLDQQIIDALPVFCYKEIVGPKEPFDCAVCLCEFADQDQLRLLPVCSHAFHVKCIDTWLLSNSTCPLCRNSLVCSDQTTLQSQFLSLEYSRQLSIDSGSVHSVLDKPAIIEEESEGLERRVYSVRLGKYRSSNLSNNEETSSSSIHLDARRCYSMGSFEYVIGDSDLLVSLTDSLEDDGSKLVKNRTQTGNFMVDGDVEAKRISNTHRGESFSVSKIWQWSKKGNSSHTNVGNSGPFHFGLPLTNKVQDVEDMAMVQEG